MVIVSDMVIQKMGTFEFSIGVEFFRKRNKDFACARLLYLFLTINMYSFS
jgi:hypothetical protein